MSGASEAPAGTTDWDTGAAVERRHEPALLQSKSLVLNRSFLPVHVTSVRRACVMLYAGLARAVDADCQTFDFAAWCRRSVDEDGEWLGLVHGSMPIPRVITLLYYDRIPRRHVRFTRHNVYSRDRDTCQYCGRRFPRHQLNLDHVIPRSQGGASSWENVVCSCHACNRRKGGHTPEQSGVRLLRHPVRPAWTPFMNEAVRHARYREWHPFLSFANDS
jgi:5-methylcytosine-specific restriction endonuclease McrA